MPTPTFFTLDAAVSTTAAKVVDAVDFDRQITIRVFMSSASDQIYVGYGSSDVNFRLPNAGVVTEDVDSPATNVILPAGKELWAKSANGAPSIYLFVGGSPG